MSLDRGLRGGDEVARNQVAEACQYKPNRNLGVPGTAPAAGVLDTRIYLAPIHDEHNATQSDVKNKQPAHLSIGYRLDHGPRQFKIEHDTKVYGQRRNHQRNVNILPPAIQNPQDNQDANKRADPCQRSSHAVT